MLNLALGGEVPQRIFDRCADGVWIVDSRGETVYANPAFLDLLGLPDAAAATAQRRPLDDPAPLAAALRRVLAGESDGAAVAAVTLAARPGGPARARVTLNALRDPDGAVRGALLHYRALGDRAPRDDDVAPGDLLARISAAEERLDAAIASVHQGILVYDLAGRVVLANPFAHELYGVAQGRLLGPGPAELAATLRDCFADRADLVAAFPAADGDDLDEEVSREYRLARPRRRVVRQTADPIYDRAGEPIGRVVTLHDITAERAADLARDELLSVASHELKTPLTSIKGFAQLLQRDLARHPGYDRGLGPARAQRHLGAMLEQLDRLGGLVDELLDVTRIEAGRLELRRERCDLAVLVAAAVERADLAAADGRRHFLLDIAHDRLTGYWDRGRLDQVLLNLLDNAVKYSPAGGTVRVTLAARRGQALLTVADEGIGVPAAQLDSLFEPFARAANALAPDYGGLGLGLYIARRIVEQHGGRIWAESAEGRGSAFHVTLPLAEEGRMSHV